MKKFLTLSVLTLGIFLSGCTAATDNQGKTVLNVDQKKIQEYTPEEKAEVLSKLIEAANKEQYEDVSNILSEIYSRSLQHDPDFIQIEKDLYKKGGDYYDQGQTDQAFKMASALYPRVFESWRFKYLKILCLDRYGTQAFEKKDYALAKDYARQILSIEYRPEGAILTAKIAIQEAQEAIQKNDLRAAKKALAETNGMNIPEEFRKQLDELAKSISN